MSSPLYDRSEESPPYEWRESLWAANGWLFFLLFPLVSIVLAEIETWQKLVGYALLAAFAVVHVVAYRAMAVREAANELSPLYAPKHIGPTNPWPYLAVLVAISAAGIALVGPGLLGFVPFIVVFGIFNFRWAIAVAIFVACIAACVAVPVVFDLFPELMFFVVIVICTAAGASFTRMAEQTSLERAALRTDLAVSTERNRVARDVHDVLGHSLTAVILKTQVCAKLLERVDPDDPGQRAVLDQVQAELGELDTVSRRAMAEIRSTVGGLRVANLSDELAAARAVLADAGVDLTVRGDTTSLQAEQQTAVAWVVREAVTNVVRHARASTCLIDFPVDDKGGPLIRITDNGVGLNDASPGNGLRGMRERIVALGGHLEFTSEAAQGTSIEVRV